ncbi:MAG: LptF/LptG family permease [Pseudomonadota bacterium]
MTRLQSYIFRHCLARTMLVLTGLTVLAFLFQALSIFDLLVEEGVAGLVFGQLVLLGLPGVLVVLVPLGLPIGLVWALRQLQSENELLVARANGVSQADLRHPVILFSILVATGFFALQSFGVPASMQASRHLVSNLNSSSAIRQIETGAFTRLGRDVTVFIGSRRGEALEHILLQDNRVSSSQRGDIYAERGAFRADGNETRLSLFDAIRLSAVGEDTAIAEFDAYQISLSEFGAQIRQPEVSLAELFFQDMLEPSLDLEFARSEILLEVQSRLSSPFLLFALGWITSWIALLHRPGLLSWLLGGAVIGGLILAPLAYPGLLGLGLPSATVWTLPVFVLLVLSFGRHR